MIALRVKVRIDQAGNMKYPEFNQLPAKVRKGLDWSIYVDRHGGGHNYDKVSGFGHSDAYNPDPDVQFTCFLVEEDFAEAALLAFPGDVEELNEAEWENFYDNRCHHIAPDEHLDEVVLRTLLLKKELEDKGLLPAPSAEELERRRKMLDPDDPTLGVRRNREKKWATCKKKCKVGRGKGPAVNP